MNNEFAVPIDDIVRFRKMAEICTDAELLKSLLPEALKGSDVVCITPDGGSLKALARGGRSTIVLRDMPDDTTEESLLEAFKDG